MKLTFFILLWLGSTVGSASTCDDHLQNTNLFRGLVQVESGHSLFVAIDRPVHEAPKGWFFLVHGLLDTHAAFDAVAETLLQQGYGVARLDLFGFGQSLPAEWTAIEQDYHDNVADLRSLIDILNTRFGVNKPHLVGHSMGGALVVGMLEDKDFAARVNSKAILLAPYVYRMEFYLFEQMASLGFGDFAASFQAYDNLPNIFKLAPESLLNLFAEPQMRYQFGRYYDHAQGSQKTDPDKRWRQVRAAIATVHGLKNLNTVRAIQLLPEHVQIQLVLGKSDVVVERKLLRRLGRAIEERGGAVLEVRSGHAMLHEIPDQIASHLIRLSALRP